MNIREAILLAADHIETNPREFDFDSIHVPDCGAPGCALGWIGAHLGVERGENLVAVCRAMGFGKSDAGLEFYRRMDSIQGVLRGQPDWSESHIHCARLMRVYADKYHPAPKVRGIPANVRAIFETKQPEAAIQSFL
jgi:hypothetical protein